MKITILLNRDLASALALRYLLPKLKQHQLTIFYTNKPSRLEPIPKGLADLRLFENQCLDGADGSLVAHPASRCTQLNNINSGTDFDRFIATAPELVLSIRHMSILQDQVIAVPRHGVINLHSGRLPQYEGVMATFWAMLKHEVTLGTTLHYIEDADIDSGAVIATSTTPADYQKSYLWNVFNVYKAGCQTIVQTVADIDESSTIRSLAQQGEGHYHTYPTQADLEKADFDLFRESDNVNSFRPTS